MIQSIFSQAQRGYKVINKADKAYQKGYYQKALKLLTKADNMSYSDYDNFNKAIYKSAIIKVSTHIQMENYQLARNILDSTFVFFATANRINEFDSLYAVSYQKEFGRTYLKRKIEEGMLNNSITIKTDREECVGLNDICIAYIPLDDGQIMRMEF